LQKFSVCFREDRKTSGSWTARTTDWWWAATRFSRMSWSSCSGWDWTSGTAVPRGCSKGEQRRRLEGSAWCNWKQI